MKPFNERCTDLDAAVRKKAGWGCGAWAGINFAEPKTDAERDALEIVKGQFPQAITVHVYVLVEFLAELIEEGKL